MKFASVPCPVCATYRMIDWEEYQLIITTQQFMCWDSCGMDVYVPPMWVFMNKVVLDGSEQE